MEFIHYQCTFFITLKSHQIYNTINRTIVNSKYNSCHLHWIQFSLKRSKFFLIFPIYIIPFYIWVNKIFKESNQIHIHHAKTIYHHITITSPLHSLPPARNK